MPVSYATLDLSYNPINYISDIANGWNISRAVDFLCLFFKRISRSSSHAQLILDRINLICDCTDFPFFSQIAFAKKSSFFNLVFCRSTPQTPYKVANYKVTRIPLDQFVCELTERCPSSCRCVRRPANATLHVYCSNANITVLPFELPELPKSYTKYKLDFSNNRFLRRLGRRDYFVDTSVLDVSNSRVQVADSVLDWKVILQIPRLNLYGNRLTSFPQSIVSVNVTTDELNVDNNPWDCSCDSKWMSDWFGSVANRLVDVVRCYSPPRLRGKNIVQMSDAELCGCCRCCCQESMDNQYAVGRRCAHSTAVRRLPRLPSASEAVHQIEVPSIRPRRVSRRRHGLRRVPELQF